MYYNNRRYIEVIYRMEETMGRYRKNIIFLWMFYRERQDTDFQLEVFLGKVRVFLEGFDGNDQQFAMVSIVVNNCNRQIIEPAMGHGFHSCNKLPVLMLCFLSQESRDHPNPFHLVNYHLFVHDLFRIDGGALTICSDVFAPIWFAGRDAPVMLGSSLILWVFVFTP